MAEAKKQQTDIYSKGAFEKEIFSAKKLAGSQPLNLRFFDGKNEEMGVSYRDTNNVFENGRGSLMKIRAELVGPAGAAVDYSTAGIRNAVQSLFGFAQIEIQRNSRPVFKGTMNELMDMHPEVILAGTNNVAVTRSMKKASKDFKRPPMWRNGQDTMSVIVTHPGAIAIPAALNDHILVLRASTLEARPENESN